MTIFYKNVFWLQIYAVFVCLFVLYFTPWISQGIISGSHCYLIYVCGNMIHRTGKWQWGAKMLENSRKKCYLYSGVRQYFQPIRHNLFVFLITGKHPLQAIYFPLKVVLVFCLTLTVVHLAHFHHAVKNGTAGKFIIHHVL